MNIAQMASFLAYWVTTRMRLRDEAGASAVEYGIMVALIAAVIVGAVTLLGGNVKNAFCQVAASLGAGCGP